VIYYSGRWIGWWSVAQPDPVVCKEQRISFVHPTNLTALKQKIQDAKAGTERKKSANFEREDGANRPFSGCGAGTGAHAERTRRAVIFCVEQL